MYVYVNIFCINFLLALGDTCFTDANCRLYDGSYGFCVRGKCSCNLNYKPSQDKTKCIKSVQLGGTCITSESCAQQYATCYGLCKCGVGFIESEDKMECLKGKC